MAVVVHLRKFFPIYFSSIKTDPALNRRRKHTIARQLAAGKEDQAPWSEFHVSEQPVAVDEPNVRGLVHAAVLIGWCHARRLCFIHRFFHESINESACGVEYNAFPPIKTAIWLAGNGRHLLLLPVVLGGFSQKTKNVVPHRVERPRTGATAYPGVVCRI